MGSAEQDASLQQAAEQVSNGDGGFGDVAVFGRPLSDVEAAEVRQVKQELAEKEEELERVRERRDLLASECESVRVEREVLRRSHADMTERMADMEGELYRTRDLLVRWGGEGKLAGVGVLHGWMGVGVLQRGRERSRQTRQ